MKEDSAAIDHPWRSLASHRGFRRLWVGDAVSALGDWFTYVAVGTLAVTAGQGLTTVAIVLVGHTLPRAVMAPYAGRLADRKDRKRVLIGATLVRALVVLAMLAAAAADSIVGVQALLFLRMAVGAFVEPASTAALPQLVPEAALGRANALLGATWSVIFGAGVVLGGLATSVLGPVGALAIDAATFLAAALIFGGLPQLPPRPSSSADPPTDDGGGGWTIAWAHPAISYAALAKWAPSLANGGAWVYLHHVAAHRGLADAALALGLLHLARAAGTGIGPFLWRGPLSGTVSGIRASVLVSLMGVALFCADLGPSMLFVAAVTWGIGVGANWVTATTRLQTVTPGDQLGRVAAVDLVVHALGQCVGGLGAAWLADHFGDARLAGVWAVGVSALGWVAVESLVASRARRRHGATLSP